ncbi:restriction endonuclease subunit S [Lactococcus lactis subsp. lactis]|uniref:restriction endonuclease subunit S n=1 Tax=Lactococcus lactis TaxID=1358 RepID=UPI0021AEFEE4|nr:restriction endonuclease subunit S [Lactococcus lactis]MCT0015554.1 restriction endonuclease subunit S [Lactococcus lactis subsp. lactis]
MSKNKKLVPKRRFKAFQNTDDWEQRELGEVLDFSITTNSLSRNMLNYDVGELRSVHYGDILVNYESILNVNTDKIPFVTGGKVKDFISQLLQDGDIVFADAAEDETVGKAVEINGLANGNLVAGLHTIVGRPLNKFADRYLGYYINSDSYHRQLIPLMQGTKVSSISKSALQKTKIIYPNMISEQKSIGTFFSNLDQTIAFQQRKLEKMKSMKSAYLSEMFPAEGERKPKRRFPGFTDDWEQCELGERARFINGRAYSQSELLDSGKYKVLRVGNFYTNSSWYYSDMELGQKYYAEKGDLLYTWSATFGPHIWDGEKVIYHYHIWKIELDDSIDKSFILQVLNNDKEELLRSTNGSTMVHITKELMESKKFLFPSLNEQKRIGTFFLELDQTIAFQQQKLEKLQNIKKAYLNEMFI